NGSLVKARWGSRHRPRGVEPVARGRPFWEKGWPPPPPPRAPPAGGKKSGGRASHGRNPRPCPQGIEMQRSWRCCAICATFAERVHRQVVAVAATRHLRNAGNRRKRTAVARNAHHDR